MIIVQNVTWISLALLYSYMRVRRGGCLFGLL